MPDVTPPSQIDNGPIGTTTHIPVFTRMLGPTQTIEPVGPALTLRYAVPSDTDAIGGLVQLDSARAPRGVVPVAEVGGRAMGCDPARRSPRVTDPFQPAGELVALLVERAQQLRRVQRGRNHLLPCVWPGTGYDLAALG